MNLIVVSSLTCDEGLFFRHISMMGKTEMGYDILIESKKEDVDLYYKILLWDLDQISNPLAAQWDLSQNFVA